MKKTKTKTIVRRVLIVSFIVLMLIAVALALVAVFTGIAGNNYTVARSAASEAPAMIQKLADFGGII